MIKETPTVAIILVEWYPSYGLRTKRSRGAPEIRMRQREQRARLSQKLSERKTRYKRRGPPRHIDVAMGHVDDPHDPEDQGKAKGDEGDDETPDESIDKKKKDGGGDLRQRSTRSKCRRSRGAKELADTAPAVLLEDLRLRRALSEVRRRRIDRVFGRDPGRPPSTPVLNLLDIEPSHDQMIFRPENASPLGETRHSP